MTGLSLNERERETFRCAVFLGIVKKRKCDHNGWLEGVTVKLLSASGPLWYHSVCEHAMEKRKLKKKGNFSKYWKQKSRERV